MHLGGKAKVETKESFEPSQPCIEFENNTKNHFNTQSEAF
jgi:hypothetical protein